LDLQTNGTTAISISASQVVTFANQPAYTGGTANGVLFLNASKVLTSGTALTFDGSQLDIPLGSAGTPSLSTPTDPNTGMFFPAADTIAFAEGGVEAMRLDSSGNLNMTGGGTANTANTFGFKNRIINGAMVIDQRNAGAVVTTESYLIDRWRVWRNQTYDIQQSTDVPTGFSNSLKVTKTSTTQSTYAYLIQYIEGFNFADMLFGTANARIVTLSFWVKSSVIGTFSAGIVNSASNRTYPATYSISSANTWEQKSITIAGDTSGTWVGSTNGTGAGVWFNFGASGGGTANSWNAADATSGVTGNANLGTTNGATFFITGVQLERGTQATSFDFRSYGTEFALCQRYFEKSVADGVAATAITNPAPTLVAAAFISTVARTQTFYRVPKRATPSVTTIPSGTVGTGNQWGWYNGTWNAGATAISQSNANAFSVDITGTYTQFYSYIIDGNWYASAEL
jgi:hypothetical protein